MNPIVLAGLAMKYRPVVAFLLLAGYHLAAGSPLSDVEADLGQAAGELFGVTPAAPAPAPAS